MDAMNVIYIRNIKLAAYLRLKGIHPDAIRKMARGKAQYGYSQSTISNESWELIKAEFDKSEFLTYGNCLDAIMDLAY